jgi:hypothetical protein
MGYTAMGATTYSSGVTGCMPRRDLAAHCTNSKCRPLIYEHYLDSIRCMYDKASRQFGVLQGIYTQAQQASAAYQQIIPTTAASGMHALAAKQRALAATSRALVDSVGKTMEQWSRIMARWQGWIRGEESMMRDFREYRYLWDRAQVTADEQELLDLYGKRLKSHNKFLFIAADSLSLIDAQVAVLKKLQKHLGTAYLQSEANVNSLTIGWKSTLEAWKAENRKRPGVLQRLGNFLGVSDLMSNLGMLAMIAVAGIAGFYILPPLFQKVARKLES